MAVEFELKYEADDRARVRLLAMFPGLWETFTMATTYYDAPDGALSARKWTLRRRLENGVSICTLKTPAGAARNEWEVPCDDIFAALPRLVEQGAPRELLTLGAGAVPICGARFTRRCCRVDREGAVLELACDEGILFAGERQAPLGEIEVELKAGPEAAAVALAQDLSEALGLAPQPQSKFKRALALARR